MGDLQQRRPWPEPPERGRGDVALCRDLWTESSFGESQIASLVGSLGDSTKRKVQNSKKIGLLSASLAMFLLSPPYIVYLLFSTMGDCKWSVPSSQLLSKVLFSHHSAPFHQFWYWSLAVFGKYYFVTFSLNRAVETHLIFSEIVWEYEHKQKFKQKHKHKQTQKKHKCKDKISEKL